MIQNNPSTSAKVQRKAGVEAKTKEEQRVNTNLDVSTPTALIRALDGNELSFLIVAMNNEFANTKEDSYGWKEQMIKLRDNLRIARDIEIRGGR